MTVGKYSIFIFLAVLFTLPAISTGQSVASVPMYHPIYEDLRYLKSQGYMSSLDLTSFPISRQDIAVALLEMEDDSIRNEFSDPVVKKLYREFSAEIQLLEEEQDLSHRIIRGIEKFTGKTIDSDQRASPVTAGLTLPEVMRAPDPTEVRGGLRTYARFDLVGNISLVNSMFGTNDPEEADKGSNKVWRGFSGYTELAYLRSQFHLWNAGFDLTFGRDFLQLGPGYRNNLLFGNTSRPFDHYKLAAQYGGLQFTFGGIQLNNHGDVTRFVNFHRLTWFTRSNLTISVNEALLYVGDSNPVDWRYMNPFLLYHGAQLNSTGTPGNTLGTIDASWYPWQTWHLWGELLIDDIQLDKEVKGDLEPNEIGIITGIGKTGFPFQESDLWMEYSFVTNRTYQTNDPDEYFVHRGYPVAHELGNDFDKLTFFYGQWLPGGAIQPFVEFSYHRNGANGLDTPFDTPWTDSTVTFEEGYEEPFPTKPITYISVLDMGLRYQPGYTFGITPSVTLRREELEGVSTSEWFFRLELWWNPRWEL